MGLLDDIETTIEIPQTPNKVSLTKQATNLIGRRRSKRGKKIKKTKSAKWQKEFNEALKKQNEMKKARADLAKHWQEANRLMK